MHLWKWSVIGSVALATPSYAGGTYVLGDSIGDGMAVTCGLNNRARTSVHIRGPKAIAQMNETPPGSTVFIALGTNDAEGTIKNIDKSIGDIVATAERRHFNMIWIGPHCVHKSWDARARELDEILRTRLANTQVRYVSMRDPRFCAGNFLEPDGVHLTASGYRHMWERARGGAGITEVAARAAPSAPALAAAPAAPAGDGNADAAHEVVMEVHVPPPTLATPLIWERIGD
jgi:lysophospholipase L1-like esterase